MKTKTQKLFENLPKSYIVTYLSFAGNWRSGTTPQRGNNEFYDIDIPWIKTGELNNSTIYDSLEKSHKNCFISIISWQIDNALLIQQKAERSQIFQEKNHFLSFCFAAILTTDFYI